MAALMSASAHCLARVLPPICVGRARLQQLKTSCTARALSITSHKPSEARMKKSSAGVTHTLLTSGMAMTACVGVLREKSPSERDTANRTVESGQFTRQQPEKITELVCARVYAFSCVSTSSDVAFQQECMRRRIVRHASNKGLSFCRDTQGSAHQHIKHANTLKHNTVILIFSLSIIASATN